jgi:hypothetical protein
MRKTSTGGEYTVTAVNPDLAHWDCWSSGGMRHADTPTPNSTPEVAMAALLEQCRLIYGEQDWSAWSWEAREFATGTRTPRIIRFRFEGGAFVRAGAQ